MLDVYHCDTCGQAYISTARIANASKRNTLDLTGSTPRSCTAEPQWMAELMVTQNREDGKICTRGHESFPRSDFLQHESGTARGLWFQPVTSDVWKLTWIIPSSRKSREAKIRENGHWGDALTALTDAAFVQRIKVSIPLEWKIIANNNFNFFFHHTKL